MEKTQAVAEAGRCLLRGGVQEATAVLDEHYPFDPAPVTKRRYTLVDSTRLFVADGFIDRYTGGRLLYPPVLRLMSKALPEAFPHHPNWKTDETHPAYWELSATLDHLIPVSRGGADDKSNWRTTSMARNSAKLNWTIEQLGWTIHPPGRFAEWDGMLGWFLEFGTENQELLKGSNLKDWYRAAEATIAAI